jgi:hypothetical protein
VELNPNLWHVKLYFWSLDVWDAFQETHTDRHRSNLCQYIRTILVLMPVALVVNICFWLYLLYVLIYYPVTRFGVVGTGTCYLVVALMTGVSWLRSRMKEKRAKRRHDERSTYPQATRVSSSDTTDDEQGDRGPGFIEMVCVYLVAMKQKVCPIIEFKSGRKQGGV